MSHDLLAVAPEIPRLAEGIGLQVDVRPDRRRSWGSLVGPSARSGTPAQAARPQTASDAAA